MSCPFCTLSVSRVEIETERFYVIRDGYPVSEGHSLIVPKTHIVSFFDMDEYESQEFYLVINRAKVDLDFRFNPKSYNIGINDGKHAGQTVMHLHIHLIPRYDGDQKDPKGGVRWIFPDKANYWS